MDDDINKKIDELEKEIEYHQNLFWEGEELEIPDKEYDELKKQLEELDSKNKLLNKVEDKPKSDNTIPHDSPMLSLDKAYTYEEILKWMDKHKRSKNEVFIIQPKLDGMAAKFYSNNNLLVSRGDGNKGENLNKLLPLIKFKTSKDYANQNIIGEIIIEKDEFENTELSTKTGKNYKTPRQMVVGLSTLNEIDNLIGRVNLTFLDHEYYSQFITYSDFNKDKLKSLIENYQNHNILPTDGIVFRFKDKKYIEYLGSTEKFPRGLISFKFPNEIKKSKLIDVKWEIGKSNRLNPVAIIKPIIIDNNKISKATLHNAKFILKSKLKIGDEVQIKRAGDSIPEVIDVINKEGSRKIKIQNCPECGTHLEYEDPFLICPNEYCGGAKENILIYGIKTLKIKRLGDVTIKKIINEFDINSVDEFLNIDYSELTQLERIKEKQAKVIEDAFENIINNPIEDYSVLASIYIPGIGEGLCKKVMERYSIDEIFNIKAEELAKIPQFEINRAETFVNTVLDKRETLEELMSTLNIKHTKEEKGINNKKKICFSGRSDFGKKYYKKIAENNNFFVETDVNKEVSVLVTNEMRSKYFKAKELGIEIISFEQFLSRFQS